MTWRPKTEERFTRNWCQGFRAGHIDGTRRVGSYIEGEEKLVELDLSDEPGPQNDRERAAWELGFHAGYRLGAEGKSVPPLVRDYALPTDGAP